MVTVHIPDRVQVYVLSADKEVPEAEQCKIKFKILNMYQTLELGNAIDVSEEVDSEGKVVYEEVEGEQVAKTKTTILKSAILVSMLMENIISIENYTVVTKDGTATKVDWNVDWDEAHKAKQLELMTIPHRLEIAMNMCNSSNGLTEDEVKNSSGQSTPAT